jgi:hypothetical protein
LECFDYLIAHIFFEQAILQFNEETLDELSHHSTFPSLIQK